MKFSTTVYDPVTHENFSPGAVRVAVDEHMGGIRIEELHGGNPRPWSSQGAALLVATIQAAIDFVEDEERRVRDANPGR